jgi:hypothetical protein
LQANLKDPPDEDSWKDDIGRRCLDQGTEPFGEDYVPISLEINNEGRRKKYIFGDLCLSMHPFIVFSEKARQVLSSFLNPVGEFLEVAAPVPGFVGYRVLKHLEDCIDMENSTYTRYDNGNVLVRKATMFESKVRGHDIFAVSAAIGGLYVSDAFRQAVEAAKLKGFKAVLLRILKEVGLNQDNDTLKLKEYFDKLIQSQNLQSQSCIKAISQFLKNPTRVIEEDDVKNPVVSFQSYYEFVKADVERYRSQNMKYECF